MTELGEAKTGSQREDLQMSKGKKKIHQFMILKCQGPFFRGTQRGQVEGLPPVPAAQQACPREHAGCTLNLTAENQQRQGHSVNIPPAREDGREVGEGVSPSWLMLY